MGGRGIVVTDTRLAPGVPERARLRHRYTHGRCRRCGAQELHRSAARNAFERALASLTPWCPLRCPACGKRQLGHWRSGERIQVALDPAAVEQAQAERVAQAHRRHRHQHRTRGRLRRSAFAQFALAVLLGLGFGFGYTRCGGERDLIGPSAPDAW